jgi:hypothetical protein
VHHYTRAGGAFSGCSGCSGMGFCRFPSRVSKQSWDAQMNMLTQPPKVFGNDSDHGSNRDSIVWFDQAPDLNSL